MRWLSYQASEDTWSPCKAAKDSKAMDEYLLENENLAKLLRETVTLDKEQEQKKVVIYIFI